MYFTSEKWLELLASKQWNENDDDSADVETLAVKFENNFEECLNEIAPYKLRPQKVWVLQRKA